MNTSYTARLRALCAIGAVAMLASCGSDTLLNPVFGANCSSGTLQAGASYTGALNAESCVAPYHFWNNNAVPYTSFDVTLEKGKGYFFQMRAIADDSGRNDLDPLLTLWGKNADGASLPLAISDDDAEGVSGYDSEFYFIAPRSGTFQLVTSGYNLGDAGGFRVSMQRCPVVGGRMDSAGTYANIDFAASNCVRSSLDDQFTTRIVLLAIPVDSGEIVDVYVDSDDFTPAVELGGPGFDVFDDIYYDDNDFSSSYGYPASVSYAADGGGVLTLAVGATSFDPAGRFSVTISRPGVTLRAPASLGSLGQMSLRPVAARPVKPTR